MRRGQGDCRRTGAQRESEGLRRGLLLQTLTCASAEATRTRKSLLAKQGGKGWPPGVDYAQLQAPALPQDFVEHKVTLRREWTGFWVWGTLSAGCVWGS